MEDCTTVVWNEWSECSAPCGGGIRFRNGTNSCDEQEYDVEECNVEACGTCDPL